MRLMGGRDACDRRGVRVNRVSVVCFPLSLFLSSFSSHYIPVLGVKWSERCLCQGLDIEVFCAVTLSSKKSAKICNRTRFSPCVQISFSTYFRSLFPFTFFFVCFCSNWSLRYFLYLMLLLYILYKPDWADCQQIT